MSDNMGIQNELVHHYETAVRSADAAGVMAIELSQRNPRCSSTPFVHKFNQLKRPYVDILTEIFFVMVSINQNVITLQGSAYI